MRPLRRLGSRVPVTALVGFALALLLLPGAVAGADWSSTSRVTAQRGSRLDSLHQMAAGRGMLHLIHPRIGPRSTDDRIVYQRSASDGVKWTRERTLFRSTAKRRHVVANLAISAKGSTVVVAFRVSGPEETALFTKTSRNGGDSFAERVLVASTTRASGMGVPAVAVGNDVIAIAWTNRANGKIKVSTSRDGGKNYEEPRTLGRTRLSIDCRQKMTDGLVGIAAADRRIHVAWSHAKKRACHAGSIKMRTTTNRGAKWKRVRMVTNRRSYGWPELDARGRTVVATVQSPKGSLIVATSGENGRRWSDHVIKPRKGHSLSAGDVVLMPKGKALIAYADERIRKAKLVGTKLVSRRSVNDGRSFKPPLTILPTAGRLRMAPNLATDLSEPVVVFQSGALDGSPRNLYSARLR